ncbi:MAG TPA: BTAD domain-containing putative transcriptional regulator [Anaerovoracaceae bacterium]|nr:BTAD domain-containing putative transcriptional regulator [Anaerovoracaceae bacterium]
MNGLCVNVLGKIELNHNDVRIENKLSAKGIALICLLLLSSGKHISRDKLISYLWADSDEEAARYNLRYNLWNIKKLIPADQNGEELILTDKDSCIINPKYHFRSDLLRLREFEHKKEESSIEELLELKSLFRGDFLEGIYIKNSDEFNEKIIFERILCQNKYVEILKRIVDRYLAEKRYQECIRILNELIVIEPYNEEFACKMMSVYIDSGQRGTAMTFYKNFESTLRKNLNISPSKELKLLYGALLEQPADDNKKWGTGRGLQKQNLKMDIQGIKGVEYYCMAEILKKILLRADRKYIYGLEKSYIEDLNHISREMGIGYEKVCAEKLTAYPEVPQVRIIEAFLKFMRRVGEMYHLDVGIANAGDLDEVSRKVFRYMIETRMEGISFRNEEAIKKSPDR